MNKQSILISAFFLTIIQLNSANAINIDGDWKGFGEGVQFFCNNPNANADIVSDVNINFDEQSNNQFAIGFVATDQADGVTNLSGAGILNANNNINTLLEGTRNGSDFVDYHFNGLFIDENTLEYDGFGKNESCSYSFGGTLTRILDPKAINPSEEQGSGSVVDVISLSRVIIHSNAVINDRLRHLLVRPKLMQLSASGFNLQSGLSAGDDENELGIWVSYDRSHFKNTFSRTRYKGNTDTLLVGVDYTLSDKLVLGSAFAYESSDIDTPFNGGNTQITGYSILPYIGYLINENWNVNVGAGISRLNYDQYRTVAGTRINGDTDSQRWFISANLNGTWMFDPFIISGNLGVISAGDNIDRYIESNGRLGEKNKSQLTTFSLGGEVTYILGEFEPYFSLDFNHDNKAAGQRLSGLNQPSDDRNDLLSALGVRYYGREGLSITAEFSKRLNRANLKEENLSVMGRWDF